MSEPAWLGEAPEPASSSPFAHVVDALCITIGAGATIGGNVWLTRSVPAGGFVTQAHARQDSFENGSGI